LYVLINATSELHLVIITGPRCFQRHNLVHMRFI